MKKFLFKLGLFALCVLLCMGLVGVLALTCAGPQFKGEFTGAISDKMEHLASIEGKKLVLVGNSNLAFGMDSAALEEKFGLPVVNLGGHGGLGNAFHLNMAREHIGEGDVVVVMLTSYGDAGEVTPDLGWITVENHGLWSLIPEEDYPAMAKAFPHYAFRAVGRWITGTGNRPREGVYSIDSFNEYGDVVYPRPESGQMGYDGVSLPPEIGETVELINDLSALCEERGAVCLVAGYPIITVEGGFLPTALFDTFTADLDAALDCALISDFKDYFLDRRYFYDTVYHLTDEGVELRTAQLIEDLKEWGLEG